MSTIIDWGVLTLQRQPWLLRAGLGLATRLLPRRLTRSLVVGADMVRETFARPEDFWMGYANAPKLKLGRFLLGMDPPYQDYFREKQVLLDTLTDLPDQIGRFASVEAEKVAESLARSLRYGGTLDLSASYAEPVFARAVGHCFGIPTRGTPCPAFEPYPNHEPLARYIRTFGSTIGSNHPAPFGLEKLADKAAPYFREHLESALRAHRAGSIEALLPHAAGVSLAPKDTVVGQLLQLAPFADGDAGIVRSVAGMISASASFPKAFATVLHELLGRPDHLRGFAAAVRAQDEARVYGYVREALRFRPVFPMLVRHCPYRTTLRSSGASFGNSEAVPFFPATAMFDPARVDHPEVFNPQRPEGVYFLFGGEPRECIGKPLMMKLFPPLFSALLRQLPRVLDARPGHFRYDGAALAGYDLQLPAATPVQHEVSTLSERRARHEEFVPLAAVARVIVEPEPTVYAEAQAKVDAAPALQPPAACPMHGLLYPDASALHTPRTPSSAPEPAE